MLSTNKYIMFQSTWLTCQLITYLSISHFLLSVYQLTIISTVEGNYLHHGVSQAIVYLEREHGVCFLQCLLLSSWQKTELLSIYNTLEWSWPWKTKRKKLHFRVTILSGVNPGLTIPRCMTLGMSHNLSRVQFTGAGMTGIKIKIYI